MRMLLTPRELAGAIGVSESSLRRWVDSGAIPMSRTAGGHRRIPLAEALRYIRETHAQVLRPELLGLEELGKAGDAGRRGEEERLVEALLAGDALRVRGIVLSMYLAGRNVARICDDAIRPAMATVSRHGMRDVAAVLTERHATDIAIGAVTQLRLMLAPAADDAPTALGGAVGGGTLPAVMAAAVVADAGFREVNYGADAPVEPLAGAVAAKSAKLVWLLVDATADPAKLLGEVERLARRLLDRKVPLILGGRAVRDMVLRDLPNLHVVQSMAELGAFARGARNPI